ncbi:hypothetical protein ADIAL_0750 [Alkalibacterium sp. AK22]|uniref:DUF624 domain-containing protein n=1 Tax=Alkalibacterium sp. AK22 TaxID=1229520 RepID=UPI0004460E2A|nr:DUF624 domain-containing protein [Alkalibacterium sp. AK22]EXJ23734.1 hypothetical protein ADIAL_0750 [Alkalibacterium sp. AK22]
MGGKVYLAINEFSKLLLQLIVLNVVWFVINMPFMATMIQIGLSTETSQLYILLTLVSLLLPVLFFPSLQALISSTRKLVKNDGSFSFSDFFRSFFSGYKNSFVIGMFYAGLMTLAGSLVYSLRDSHFIFWLLPVVVIFYLNLAAFNLLYFDAHYDMPLSWKFKQVMVLILTKPVFSLLNFVFFIGIQYIIFSLSVIIFILFGTAVTIYSTYYLFLWKLKKIKNQQTH